MARGRLLDIPRRPMPPLVGGGRHWWGEWIDRSLGSRSSKNGTRKVGVIGVARIAEMKKTWAQGPFRLEVGSGLGSQWLQRSRGGGQRAVTAPSLF